MNTPEMAELFSEESFLERMPGHPKHGYRPSGTGAFEGPVDFQKIFGNRRPVELEIGCGKGKFILERAAAHPEINFVGLDWSRKWLAKGILRRTHRALRNVRLFWIRAQEFLDQVPPKSLAVVHIYFPDPWPKRRHEARRLVQPEFLDQLGSRLLPGGRVEIATDDAEYHQWMKSAVGRTASGWTGLRLSKNERLFDREHQTHYEIKFAREGRDRFYMELQK